MKLRFCVSKDVCLNYSKKGENRYNPIFSSKLPIGKALILKIGRDAVVITQIIKLPPQKQILSEL